VTERIPFIRPSFPDPADVSRAYEEIVEANWFTNFGPFERRLASAMGTSLGDEVRVATFANATLALVGAVSVVMGRGDHSRKVLVPSFTFAAGPQALVWAGYRPAFVDIDRETWQPDVAHARELVSRDPSGFAGILLGNTLGTGNARIAEWEQFAQEVGLPLVVDSAAGFGSDYSDGRRVGTAGDCEIFSMHATKPFGVGEGGAVASHDSSIIERLEQFQNFGFGPDRDSTVLGLNAKLPELSAAIGILQLERLAARLVDRRATLAAYVDAFQVLGISVLPNSDRAALGCGSFRVRSADHRVEVMRALDDAGVEARTYYSPPVHRHAWFAQHAEECDVDDLPETEAICAEVVSLPIHDEMDPADIERVIKAVASCR
jgi:dTDP-4-amino-4,6-dideoxygalactose transaminase